MSSFLSKSLQWVGILKAAPIIIGLLALLILTNLDFNPAEIIPGFGKEGRWIRGEVTRVIDGDTLAVKTASGKETVRMIGIDTPETVRPGVEVECGGPEASAYMHRIAEGLSVKLVTDPTQDERDRYGRLLAYVYPSGKRHTLQEKILSAGLAEVYVFAGSRFQQLDEFRAAERSARGRGLGSWSTCGGNFHSAS